MTDGLHMSKARKLTAVFLVSVVGSCLCSLVAAADNPASRNAERLFKESLYGETRETRAIREGKAERLPAKVAARIIRKVLSNTKRQPDRWACIDAMIRYRAFDSVYLLRRVVEREGKTPATINTRYLRWMAYLGYDNPKVAAYCKDLALRALDMEALEKRLARGRDPDDLIYADLIPILWALRADNELARLRDAAGKRIKEFEDYWDGLVGKKLDDVTSRELDKRGTRSQWDDVIADGARDLLEYVLLRERVYATKEVDKLRLLAQLQLPGSGDAGLYVGEWAEIMLLRHSTRESASAAMRRALEEYRLETRKALLLTRLSVYKWLDKKGDGLTQDEEKAYRGVMAELDFLGVPYSPGRRVKLKGPIEEEVPDEEDGDEF